MFCWAEVKSRKGLNSQNFEFSNRLNQYFTEFSEYTKVYFQKMSLCIIETLVKAYIIVYINTR